MSDLSDPSATAEFDYIIVGSGAGGAPLAARLAQAGKRVLILEAGENESALKPTDGPREVSEVPAFHGVSTENPELSWRFFVKHYGEANPPSGPDPKWYPSEKKGEKEEDLTRHGIFYPRAAALGGCTIHNAMITIAGPDSDWDDLADFLRDDSWRSETMRAYFERLERNEYASRLKLPETAWAKLWDNVRWLFGVDRDYSNGRHGFDGWLRTSVADLAIGLKDIQLIKMLKAALRQAERAGIDRFFTLVYHFLRGRIRESLDPNHARTQALSPEGVALIPLAVGGKNGRPAGVGHRSSPRELLLEVQSRHPDNLVIWTNCFVTELLFEKTPKLRAVGVQYLKGRHLYHAHPTYEKPPTETHSVRVKAGGEVILCGGSFNTPQLLMLSGIGDKGHLKERGIDCQVHSPGVGLNLHDRYEVTVVSEMKHDFSLLKGATFRLPENEPPDPYLQEWRTKGTGLYSSNGSVLGILKRSRPDLDQPDLFIFGIPLSFKGYSVGYSKDPKHNFFTWAILKARTRNRAGTVRLRDANPLETPEINFHYFQEGSEGTTGDDDDDLLALVEGVKFVRGIARHATLFVNKEDHPGKDVVPDGDDGKLKDWIRREAWGHHACGSCRMGPPEDENAVLDSRFRVLGEAPEGEGGRPVIEGLRVVDASIFPKIPGYFIVTNIYMASEKAADVILEDAQFAKEGAVAPDHAVYPRELREKETELISTRRKEVNKDPSRRDLFGEEPLTTGDTWSGDIAGLALSGGGVRSATFNLGVIQALAKSHCLRQFDFLSTVSGGGYIGCFLGRFYDRLRGEPFSVGRRESVHPAADRVEHELSAPDSPEIAWLRKHGNYIAPSGAGDVRFNAAVVLRNFLSVHFVVGALVFALFGLANAVRYGVFDKVLAVWGLIIDKRDMPLGHLIEAGFGVFWSPWFVLFELIVLFVVVPRLVGYWMASQDEHERYQRPALRLVFILVAVLLFLGLHDGLSWEPVFLALSLLTAFGAVELAWRWGRKREQAVGTGGVATQRLRTRNYLTMDLGAALALGGIALAFALVDTAGHSLQQLMAQNKNYAAAFAKLGALLAALIPIVRMLANFFVKEKPSGRRGPSFADRLKKEAFAGILAVVLFAVPLIFYSFAAHAVYDGGNRVKIGVAATILALVISWILARREALPFINRSSLAETYAARLARAYLGASNPLRHHPTGANIDEVMAGDDVSSIQNYRPYETGGPLHLINLTVNQTVDFTSQRGNRDRKGEPMAVSCLGVSVGKKWHSIWDETLAGQTTHSPAGRTLRTKDIGRLPGTEHPLVDLAGDPAQCAENLPLRKWMSISGAAIGPGRGQTTKLGTALLFGLANLRTGYWWDSGISDVARDGFPALSFFRRLLFLVPPLFVTQSSLIFEWIARYPGPWERLWYLSDGGFFENLGLYELVRRRVPRMLVCDATTDPTYEFEELGALVRKARIDFNARIVPLEQAEITVLHGIPNAIGTFDDLKPSVDNDGNVTALSRKSGALFWVHYDTAPYQSSLLLYLKAKLTGDETADVRNYYETHRDFPHESTGDQFFEEDQWESYRKLGESLAWDLFSDPSWFWRIQLPK
jgi:choline dehydrogenase-like flavoprotein